MRVKCIISEQIKSWTVLGHFSTDLKNNENTSDILEWCLPIRSYILSELDSIQTDKSLQIKLSHKFYPVFSFFQQMSSGYIQYLDAQVNSILLI